MRDRRCSTRGPPSCTPTPRSRSTPTWPRRPGARPWPSRWPPTTATTWTPWRRRSTSARAWSSCATPTTPRASTGRPRRSRRSSTRCPRTWRHGQRGLLRLRGPSRRRAHDVAGPRAPQPPRARTFSKAHGLCGLRVGYGVGSAAWVAAIDKVRQPFNTNALAQAAALESLRHPAELDRRVREVVSERARMERALAETGWAFTPSRANFILVRPDSDPVAGSSRCPRAASAPRRHRARRRRAGMPRAPEGLHRDPGGERGIPVGACAARPPGAP